MATYEEIYGKRVEVLDADPTLNSSYEGQVWYNSASGTLKSVVSAAAWHATSNMLTGRGQTGGTGTQTAALIVGGNSPITNKTEEYNGSGFSNGGNLPFSRMEMGVAGPQTAAVAFGGFTAPPPPGANATVEYDGSSWTSGNNMNQGRTSVGSAGTQTAALAFGGSEPNSPGQWTEEYDGTNWTAQNNLGTGRYQLMGNNVGTQTAALCVGGFISTAKDLVEEYDGTNWTATTALPTAGGNQMRIGISTAALAAGGTPGPNDGTKCYSFDGSTWSATASLATPRSSTSGGGSNTAAVDAGAPSNSATSEEFNISINTFTAAAWASGTAVNTGRYSGFSTASSPPTSLLFFGGTYGIPGVTTNTAKTEEYNGTAWAEQTDMPAATTTGGTGGTQTAAISMGGYQGTSLVSDCFSYNGSSWGTIPSLPTATGNTKGCGTSTAGLLAGGKNPGAPSGTTATYEYDGEGWASANAMSTPRWQSAVYGVQTAAVASGGQGFISTTEEYDGTNWTSGGALITASGYLGSNGAVTDGLVYAGETSPAKLSQCVGYDGTAYSTRPSMATARGAVANGGGDTSATAVAISGDTPGSPSAMTTAVEDFTGVTETVAASTLTTE